MPAPLFATLHNTTGFDAVETGTAVEVAAYDVPVGVSVSGTFVGTCLIEISMDGTNFVTYATHTAPGVTSITIPVKQVRARCSAFTSGSIQVLLGAKNSSTDDQ
jgi:hypothetical protein